MNEKLNIVSVTAEVEAFKNERILNNTWASRYPGTGWMPILADNLKKKNIKVTTADVALSHVECGFWEAKEIGVIQHLDDPVSEKLISLGAVPIILTALESPLYAPDFLSKVSVMGERFPKRVMLSAIFDICNFKTGGNFILRFPSFHVHDIQSIVPWSERSFMTVVTSNIYNLPISPYFLKHPFDIVKWLRRKIIIFLSNKPKAATDLEYQQLIDRRLSAILFFAKKGCLHLYGRGWENISNLPRHYSKQLYPLMKELGGISCIDKIQTIKKYKFVLCFENAAYKGGLSEKIIDCFVAGAIPLYLGATDIQEFVPVNSFIDIRSVQTWDELYDRLKEMTELEAMEIIQNGRNFLQSEEGRQHSYEGFSTFMQALVTG